MTKKRISIIVVLIVLAVLSALYVAFYLRPSEPIRLKQLKFGNLPNWTSADLRPSFKAFNVSCKAFLKHNPDKDVGSKHIELKAEDWRPACLAAKKVDAGSKVKVKQFFQKWFTPAAFYRQNKVKGLFTGYYMPVVHGSLTKSKTYNVPVYGVPEDLITAELGKFDSDLKHHRRLFGRVTKKTMIPYHTREDILKGAINGKAPVIAWLKSPVELQFLEIEGSGIIQLENGKRIAVGYAAQNGQPYTPIASVLIGKNAMTLENASMQRIKKYLKENPNEVNEVLYQNKSFVFFRKQKTDDAFGSQGVALTAGYSLAVDRKWVPMGVPLWLKTTRPDKEETTKPMHRLMIAQDTGGAILGPVRGDVYWGAGDDATYIAGHMKNKGYYWLLLPKTYFQVNVDNKSKETK